MPDLLRPVYRATASNGYFGRSCENLTWVHTNKANVLRDAASLAGSADRCRFCTVTEL